jgi:hemerythrin-like metal-binding protein
VTDKAGVAAPIFPWREQYRVGIPQIDGQHRELVGLVNQLHSAMLTGAANPALGRIIDELVRHAQSHFSYEERLLQERGHPGLSRRRATHERLTRQIRQLQEQFRSGQLRLRRPVTQFLKESLAKHILTRDMD